MTALLPYIIGMLALWAAARVWQVRKLSVRLEEVRRHNNEQDRPVKG
ncbi:MAG TPA: hypothetical protein PL070_09130 [Flavobacteriales bacterium]|nr:hypothetical protein [Flavobacteriales bacterium]